MEEQLNVIQSLLKARETLFRQIAYLTERVDFVSKKLERLQSKYEKLISHFEDFNEQDEEMTISEWLEKTSPEEDAPGSNEDFL